jgi:hypothetical protein
VPVGIAAVGRLSSVEISNQQEEIDMKVKTKVKAGPRDCAIYI